MWPDLADTVVPLVPLNVGQHSHAALRGPRRGLQPPRPRRLPPPVGPTPILVLVLGVGQQPAPREHVRRRQHEGEELDGLAGPEPQHRQKRHHPPHLGPAVGRGVARGVVPPEDSLEQFRPRGSAVLNCSNLY